MRNTGIIPSNLPGGSMVLRAEQYVALYRLNMGLALPFFTLPLLSISGKPLVEGLFFVYKKPGAARTGEKND
jgi:hypothetical protein